MAVTLRYIADILEGFLFGTGNSWAFGDFLCVRQKDPYLESIRSRCGAVAEDYPGGSLAFCSPEGLEVLEAILDELQAKLEEEA